MEREKRVAEELIKWIYRNNPIDNKHPRAKKTKKLKEAKEKKAVQALDKRLMRIVGWMAVSDRVRVREKRDSARGIAKENRDNRPTDRDGSSQEELERQQTNRKRRTDWKREKIQVLG